MRPASGHVADALGITEGENVIHLRTLRRVNGVALCLIDHYFADLTLWPTLQRFDSGSLHDFLREQTGIALRRSQTRIAPAAPRPKSASALKSRICRRCCACAPLTTVTVKASPAEYSVSLTRADMIEFTMEH
ncbi:UTRA domain-containing protein [Escherichia coli]